MALEWLWRGYGEALVALGVSHLVVTGVNLICISLISLLFLVDDSGCSIRCFLDWYCSLGWMTDEDDLCALISLGL
jgi:hypothetical protein